MRMNSLGRMVVAGGIGATSVLLSSGVASAATFDGGLVQNGSFENPGVPSGYVVYPAGSTAITGWTVGQGSVMSMGSVEQDSTQEWPADTGSVSLDLSGNSPGDIYQSFSTTPGATYTVSFALGGNFYCNGMTDANGLPEGPLKTATVSWESGGQPQVARETFNSANSTQSSMGYRHIALQFVANSPTTTLDFADSSAPQTGCGAVIDSVNVAATPIPATPESPITVGLPAAGAVLLGGGVLFLRRRNA